MDTTFEATVLSRAVHRHLREGRAQRANALVAAWRERSPGDATPMALQAVVELASGNQEQAQALSRQAMDIDRNNAHACAAAAQVHVAGGRVDDALSCARTALNLEPALTETAQLLAQLHLQRGDTTGALSVLRQAAVAAHPDVEIELMLAEMQLRGGDGVDEAEQTCRRICESRPDMAAAWALHALAVAMLGDFRRAQQEFKLALALEPDNTVYLLELARLYLMAPGSPPSVLADAAELTRKVLALNPKEWQGWVILAEAQKRQHQFMSAMKTLTDATKTLPEQGELWMELARTCGAVGHVLAAGQALDKAEELKVPLTTLWPLRFDLALRGGESARAFACFDSADEVLRAQQHRLAPLSSEPGGDAGITVGFHASGLTNYLMFARYLAALAERGVTVHLWAPEVLAPLLRRVRGVSAVAGLQAQLPADHVEPITRVPVLLGMADDALPSAPYLSADPTVVEGIRLRRAAVGGPVMLLDLGDGAEAGLVHQLGKWLQEHGVHLVLLRMPPSEWRGLNLPFQVLEEDNFEQLAAWLVVADFVVGADVPLSHMAGGMGIPANVVLPLGADGVWTAAEPMCPWYPSLRLYRELPKSGWGAAWSSLKEALDGQLASSLRQGD